ncbi:MAG: META domain-containing protein [Anaerolineae bacterium]|nr:META domain-containing protein [Anaerolineae bacterium]
MKNIYKPFYFMAILALLATTLLPATTQAQDDVVCESEVTVAEGDWLSTIANDAYGDPTLYTGIAAATNLKAQTDSTFATIASNDVIEPGWKLCIPDQATAEALSAGAPATATAAATGLTVDQLANATYSGIYEEPVTLTEGRYEGEPFVEGGASRPTVNFNPNEVAFGDLNGDGVEDAVVLLSENSGGSGTFIYLAAVINQDGQPVNVATTQLPGNGPQLKSMTIEEGQIILEVVTQGPDDPECCPTAKQRLTYTLQDDALTQVSVEDLGKVSLADLNGTSWRLVDFNFDQQPVPADVDITANFSEGQLSGFAGCNNYTTSIATEGEFAQSLVISPIAATLMACPEPGMSLETQYLAALQSVSQWSYLAAHLALTYETEDGGIATLMFEPVATEAAAPAESSPALTREQLANATYSGIYDDPVTLTDGRYEGEPFVEGDASRPTVTMANAAPLMGDLNGDGVDDAVVFLEENSGGTGHFVYVAAQLNQDGQPVDAGTVLIEDRIQIKSAAIENGQIMLEIVTEGPGDAACCKSHKTHKTYALQDGQLAEIPGPEEELVRISADDLNGTTWTLVDLNFDQQPVLTDTEVTISFQDGQITGSGGCNTYNTSFTLGEDNPFVMTISPVASTRMACPEPILTQENAFFTALQNVSLWGYNVGQLALSYRTDDGGFGTLLFAPPAPAADEAAAGESELSATEVIDFTPTDIPTETQAGSCFTNAIGLGRADAWRCTVGNQIYDPCFAVDDKPTVVCDANPATGTTGFVLDLTEPLPEPDAGDLAQPWLVELADGQVCGLMTGTIPGVDDRVAPYGCPDGSYLFEDFQQDGDVWLAEKAVIGLNDNGFFIEQSEMVPISRIWQ